MIDIRTNVHLTPRKFVTLAAFAILVALGTTGFPAPRQPSVVFSMADLYRSDAIAYDNGPLTENFYLAASYTPITPTRGPERHEPTSAPQAPQPVIRHSYPPLAR